MHYCGVNKQTVKFSTVEGVHDSNSHHGLQFAERSPRVSFFTLNDTTGYFSPRKIILGHLSFKRLMQASFDLEGLHWIAALCLPLFSLTLRFGAPCMSECSQSIPFTASLIPSSSGFGS